MLMFPGFGFRLSCRWSCSGTSEEVGVRKPFRPIGHEICGVRPRSCRFSF